MRMLTKKMLARGAAATLVATVALAGAACSAKTENKTTASPQEGQKKVTLVTYESFPLDDKTMSEFTKETGYKVEIVKSGDGVELTNKLILTKDAPLGDVAFGMNAAVVNGAVDAGVFADRTFDLPQGAEPFALGDTKKVSPVDHSQVCLNYDVKWFAEKGITPPTSFDDLLKPEMKDLTVTLDPRSSTPGLSNMLATIAKYGKDGWADYWKKLAANGMKVAKGWSDAFSGDFTAGENKSQTASRPIMVSYASSPAWAVNDDKTASAIGNVPATCWNEIEYIGVLAGTKNMEGAQKLAEFLLGKTVQQANMESNYVYPVRDDLTLPEDLAKFGAPVQTDLKLDAKEVNTQREAWLRTWTEAVGG